MNKFNEIDVLYIILTSYLVTILILLLVHKKQIKRAETELNKEYEEIQSNQKMETQEIN